MNNILNTLKEVQQFSNKLDPSVFIMALSASLAASLFALMLYQFFYENRGTGSQVHRSFPLLSISITTLFIGVQLSLPLSLGLLGALSIIRFRTPVKEPEEVGFIMLVIASSISCATFNFQFLIILYAMAVIALVILRGGRVVKYFKHDGLLLLTLKDEEADISLNRIIDFVNVKTGRSHFESSSSKDGVTSLHLSFTALKIDVPSFQKGIKEIVPSIGVNLFFNRPGGIR